jgi:hypothetical protein
MPVDVPMAPVTSTDETIEIRSNIQSCIDRRGFVEEGIKSGSGWIFQAVEIK